MADGQPGRPSIYTDELAAEICSRLAEGRSLRSVCREQDMPALSSVFLWLKKYPEFSEQYAHAKEAAAEVLFGEMFDIADDQEGDVIKLEDGREIENHNTVARAKLRVDTRKWALARMAPRTYGDRQAVEHTGSGGVLVVPVPATQAASSLPVEDVEDQG